MPSKRTPEIVDIILAGIRGGQSLCSVCRDDSMPDQSTFVRWCNDDSNLAQQ